MLNPGRTARSLVVGAAALCTLAAPALGADLPTRKSPPLAAPPPVFSWTGFYLGFNYGYAWRDSAGIGAAATNLFDTTIGAPWGAPAAIGATGVSSARLNGFFGGAQAGYNWQFSDRFVAGVEADIQGGGVRGGGGYGAVTSPALFPGLSVVTSATVKRSLEYFGTLRGRLGYTITPTLLVYATGGLAYGGVSANAKITQTMTPSLLATGGASADGFRNKSGWTIGAGSEWAITPNLSAKFEYLYYDLGRANIAFPNFGFLTQTTPGGASVGSALVASTRYNGHIVRAGLNYRFGGFGPAPATSAATPLFASPSFVSIERPAMGAWQVSITPYMWATGMNGSTTALGQTLTTNVSMIDMLTKSSSLPLELAARLEARNGPLFLYGDLFWAQIRMSGSVFGYRPIFAGISLAADANASMKTGMTVAEAGAGYELTRWGVAGSPGAFTAIDAYAGLRYWRIAIDVSLDITAAINAQNLGLSQIGNKAIARSGAMTWADPLIGMRLRHQLASGDEFQVRGDVGGFGVGSKFSWQAFGGYQHNFEWAGFKMSSTIGYRALGVDYSKGSGFQQSGVNMILHGPVAGLGMRF
jgi:opacity protein-like surface antigen